MAQWCFAVPCARIARSKRCIDQPAFTTDIGGVVVYTMGQGYSRSPNAMSKAHVDPAELRRFAQDLARFNNELQSLVGGLHARMRNLENTWRDQEQRKFSEAFE